ncbi:MAG: ribosome assembly RNA-binding protein YhbY [Deltaproteobacteria bacterium]|nr:ribosome assembly RNA-binding protein YhbY [Deltaproteobacteria bacterium]
MLTGKHRRNLRALGHALKPLVQVGKGGIDDGLVAAVDRALADHELIKIKVSDSADVDRHEAADAIAQRTHSEVAQVLGYTLLLYRAFPEDPVIDVATGTRREKPKGPAPKVHPPAKPKPPLPRSKRKRSRA